MSFSTTYDTILTRFKGQMDTLRPLVPIAWPNMPFDPLDDFDPATHQGWRVLGCRGANSYRHLSAGRVTGDGDRLAIF